MWDLGGHAMSALVPIKNLHYMRHHKKTFCGVQTCSCRIAGFFLLSHVLLLWDMIDCSCCFSVFVIIEFSH